MSNDGESESQPSLPGAADSPHGKGGGSGFPAEQPDNKTDANSHSSASPKPPPLPSLADPAPPGNTPRALVLPEAAPPGHTPRPNGELALAVREDPAEEEAEARQTGSWSRHLEATLERLPNLPTGRCPLLARCDCTDALLQVPQLLSEKIWHYPWAFIVFYSIIAVVAICVAWREVVINTDVEAFGRVDAEASMHHDVYQEALRHSRANVSGDSLSDRTAFKLELFYEVANLEELREAGLRVQVVDSVLKEAALRDIRSFEHRLRELPGWRRLCNLSAPAAQYRCLPGESLGNYLWPRRLDSFMTSGGFFRLAFDGSARERLPVDATLAYLTEYRAAPYDPWNFLPQGYRVGQTEPRSLRSTFVFTSPDVWDAGFRREYHEFVENELYPMLVEEVENSWREPDPNSWDQPMHVHISFRGDVIDEYELRRVLEKDLKNASWALVFTFLICWFQFCSLFLAFSSALLLSIVALTAYIITPVPKVGLASFLAVFLVYGLGTHTLFRLHATWRRSRGQRGLSGPDRVLNAHTTAVLHLLPLMASALCFYLCLYTLLRPLREFGLFMGSGMLLTCVLAVLVFLPVLVLHEEYVRPVVTDRLPKWLVMVLEPNLQLPWKMLAAHLAKAVSNPRLVLGVTASIWFLVFIPVVIVAALRDGTGLPELFPPNHNLNVAHTFGKDFAPVRLLNVEVPAPSTLFCEPGPTVEGCSLHWCEAPLPDAEQDNISVCTCYANVPKRANCDEVTVTAMFSGADFADRPEKGRMNMLEQYAKARFEGAGAMKHASGAPRRLPSLVLENWESGATNIEPLISMPPVRVKLVGGTEICEEAAVCHCGQRACQAPAGYSGVPTVFRQLAAMSDPAALSTNNTDASSTVAGPEGPDLASERQQLAEFDAQQGTEVVVVFGILQPTSSKFLDGTPEWSFDTSFDPLSPWAQRAMYAVCADVHPELNVLHSRCWISGFRTWLLNRGDLFPVKRFDNFHEQVRRYLQEDPMAAADMWLDADGNARAARFHFKVGQRSSSTEVLEDQKRWREYIAGKNNAASSTASGAWVTSMAWVEMEAFDEALASAWRVCLLVILSVLVSGLVYTMDLEIVGCVALICLVACNLLLFFMLCIFQWQFGPWQLLIVTLFLSYSVEPALHIGRDFVLPALPSHAGRPPSLTDAGALSAVPQLGNGHHDGPGGLQGNGHSNGHTNGHANHGNGHWPGSGSDGPNLDTTGTLVGVSGPGADGDADGEPSPALPPELGSNASPPRLEPRDVLELSVQHACETMVASSLQLLGCGMVMLPCSFRLFTQLGAVAMLIPFVWALGTLLLLPAAVLFSERTRREPDLWLLWRRAEEKASSMLS